MIKNILFGSDGSPFGTVAGMYAFDLADRLDARLEAVHVLDSRRLELASVTPPGGCLAWLPPGVTDRLHQVLHENGETILKAIAEEGAKRGIPIRVSLEFGVPPQVFDAIQSRTELVVLGRQGEHARSGGDFTGSTMERYIRRASRCCMVTPGTFTPIQKILVAVDGSVFAARALHEAAELANALSAPLVILSVAEREATLSQVKTTAEEAHSFVRAHNCAAGTLTAIGAPALRILETADATHCDLIVLGAHGHGWIYDRLIGSVAAHVVSHGPAPVLLVR